MNEHVQEVCSAICRRFFVTVADVEGKRRTKNVAAARQCCMFVIRTQFGFSYPEIGRQFGNRDHTTAMSACRNVNRILERGSDARLTEAVQAGLTVVDAMLAARTFPVKAIDRPHLDRASGE